jgi:hypothetical protein
MRRLGLLLAAVLVACGGRQPALQPRPVFSAPAAPPAAPPPAATTPPGLSRPPTPQEAELIQRLSRDTERLRGLRFRTQVAVRIQDRLAMRAYVEGALDDEELAHARRRYLALGLLSPDVDVRQLIVALMEEELVGYYDPEQKLLAIRNDVADALAQAGAGAGERKPSAEGDLEWRATVVHELVHALQDQHLGLSTSMHAPRTTDEENAYGAVIEGDATLVMLGYVAERQGGSLEALVSDTAALARGLHDSPLAAGGRLAQAPAIVREPLLFRYREGAVFAARLFAQGGWRAVNEAHARLPPSTSAVRDGVQKSFALEAPELELAWPACTTVDRDVLGSLELGAALSRAALPGLELARGWRGDAYRVLACGAEDASLWFLRLASPGLARRARNALLSDDTEHLRVVLQQGGYLLVARRLDPSRMREIEPQFRAWAGATR